MTYLRDIEHGHHCDRAEGLTLYGEGQLILVVYDSPDDNHEEGRVIFDGQGDIVGVYADILPLQ